MKIKILYSLMHRLWLLILFVILASNPAIAQDTNQLSKKFDPESEKSGQKEIVFSMSKNASTCSFEFVLLFYTEVFRRIGYKFRLKACPAERCLQEANSGNVDGDSARITFGSRLKSKYPNLVQVMEPISETDYCAYSTDSAIRVNGWESLKGKDIIVGFPKGIKIAEMKLPKYVDPQNIERVTSQIGGLRMLVAGRIDLFLLVERSGDCLILQEEFKDTNIQKSGALETFFTYPYLHSKHKKMIPDLIKKMREMKDDGTYDKIMRQATMALRDK